MAYTFSMIQSVTADGSDTCRATIALTGDSELKVTNLVIPANTANYPVNASFLTANLIGWFAYANQSVKLITNSTVTPGDTVNFSTSSPSQWWNTACGSNPFGHNVNQFYITNNNVTTAARVDLYLLWTN